MLYTPIHVFYPLTSSEWSPKILLFEIDYFKKRAKHLLGSAGCWKKRKIYIMSILALKGSSLPRIGYLGYK